MYKGYKIVCVTPAGRRRYLKLLAPYILNSPFVDRWDLWENTVNKHDIAFLRKLEQNFEKVKIVKHPNGKIDGTKSINDFFTEAIDFDTVYIRFDDDVVWVAPDFFEKFLNFRINNPQYFLVFPLIINNAVCSHLLQMENKLNTNIYISANAFDPIGWKNSEFAYKLHKLFLNILIKGNFTEMFLEKNYFISLNRFSINCMSWFGKDFFKFGGKVIGDEEEFLTVVAGARLERCNIIFGKTLVSHYAFGIQRKYLDNTDILNNYENVLLKSSNDKILTIYNTIKKILSETEQLTFRENVKIA